MFIFPSFFANLSYVAPDVIRCMQPFTRAQWDGMHKRHGFKTIINLRGSNPSAGWYKDEVDAAKAHDCRHIDLTLSSKRLPAQSDLLQLLDYYRDCTRPLLIKCSGGADRTGLASGMYLLDTHGIDAFDEALSYLRFFPYLHYAKPQQRWIREFFLYFADTHEGLTLRDWVSDVYSQEAFKKRLIEQDKADYWRRGWA